MTLKEKNILRATNNRRHALENTARMLPMENTTVGTSEKTFHPSRRKEQKSARKK